MKKQESHTIRIKPGWKKGTKITFEGLGNERPGFDLPADIVFNICEKAHPTYKRVGNDLVVKAEVPLVNALTGWTFSFRHLNGDRMTCTFADEIIFPGYEKVIQGQGMPIVGGEKGAKGDLRIKLQIVFPTKLSSSRRSELAKILRDN